MFKDQVLEYKPPAFLERRMAHLAYNLVFWEAFLIFAPFDIRVDIADVLAVKGGTLFDVIMSPCGRTFHKP